MDTAPRRWLALEAHLRQRLRDDSDANEGEASNEEVESKLNDKEFGTQLSAPQRTQLGTLPTPEQRAFLERHNPVWKELKPEAIGFGEGMGDLLIQSYFDIGGLYVHVVIDTFSLLTWAYGTRKNDISDVAARLIDTQVLRVLRKKRLRPKTIVNYRGEFSKVRFDKIIVPLSNSVVRNNPMNRLGTYPVSIEKYGIKHCKVAGHREKFHGLLERFRLLLYAEVKRHREKGESPLDNAAFDQWFKQYQRTSQDSIPYFGKSVRDIYRDNFQ